MSIVEGFKELVEFYKAVLEIYEKRIVLQKNYPDIWKLKPEAVLRLGDLLGHERFAVFMRGLLMLEWIREKLTKFTELTLEEQEEVVAKFKEAVSLMENALQEDT